MVSYEAITSALGSGRFAEMERLCRERLQAAPLDENLLLLLALSQQRQGRHAEAIANYRRLTDLFPGSGLHWGNYAAALRETGALDESAKAYETASRLAPDDAGLRMNRGLMLLEKRDYLGARDALLDACALDRDSAPARIHAAHVCTLCGDARAPELIEHWTDWLPLRDDALQMELAQTLSMLSDARSAATLLEELAARVPGMAEARLRLGALYERMNRLDDAEATLQALLDTVQPLDAPMRNEALRLQARILFRRGELAGARALLEDLGPRDSEDYAHYYELAEIDDKLGAAHEATQSLAVAHARQMAELKLLAPQGFAPGAPVLPMAATSVSRDEYARWPAHKAPEEASSPVFIVGFPRSGTTLLEQMLDAHPQLQSMDEQPFFNILSDRLGHFGVEVPRDLHKLSQRDCDELRKDYWELVCKKVPRDWRAQLVDKNPMNMLWLPMIHRLFPAAKFILALRHPCDVVLSCYMQNFRSTALATACVDLGRLSEAYAAAMRHWLHHVELFQPRVLVSRYEDLVEDLPGQTRRIAAFLGLPDDEPLRRFDRHARAKGYIATPSYTQVIQPVNRKGLDRWRRYRAEFEPLLPTLEPMLRHWGYNYKPAE